MARSLTNNFSLSYTIETALGTAGTDWFLLEPNGINTFGSDITTVAREPISKNRQRQAGTITDLDSSVEFEHDLTIDSFRDFIEGFVFSTFQGPVSLKAGTDFDTLAAVASGPHFTHDDLSAALAENTLIYNKGWTNTGNNGLLVVDTGSAVGQTELKNSPSLVDETPAESTRASISVAGHRGATGDITWTFGTLTIGSTTLDFTTLSLSVGQFIHIGGTTSTTQFNTGTAFARIVSIAANAIVVDKLVDVGSGTLSTTSDTGSGKQIDLLFGQFLKNVSVDDSTYLERSFQFEGAYENLQNPTGTGDEYEYPAGNYCNTAAFNLPLTDKATVTWSFIGTDTATPSSTRKTGASAPIQVVDATAFNTSSDIGRLRITETDETGLTSDFKSITLTLNNNVSGEKVLGTLGSKFINAGNFDVDLEAQLLFTDSDVPAAIRANTTVTMEFILDNNDGGIAIDIPSMKLGGGGREFPVNESILINLTGEAFEDATLGSSIGVSLFPVLP